MSGHFSASAGRTSRFTLAVPGASARPPPPHLHLRPEPLVVQPGLSPCCGPPGLLHHRAGQSAGIPEFSLSAPHPRPGSDGMQPAVPPVGLLGPGALMAPPS